MQYELWAKPRFMGFEYKFIRAFYDIREMDSMIDTLDSSKYQKAMILETEIDKEPIVKMYVELEKPKELKKRK